MTVHQPHLRTKQSRPGTSPQEALPDQPQPTGSLTTMSTHTVHRATDVISEACNILVEEFEGLIGRRFASQRTIRLELESEKHWTAVIDADEVLYRSPDREATVRFVRTFAIQTAGVVVDEVSLLMPDLSGGFSVRVPDNVVPIRGAV